MEANIKQEMKYVFRQMVVGLIMFILGWFTGMGTTDDHWKENAIKSGHGEYNSQTAEFQWVTNRVDK